MFVSYCTGHFGHSQRVVVPSTYRPHTAFVSCVSSAGLVPTFPSGRSVFFSLWPHPHHIRSLQLLQRLGLGLRRLGRLIPPRLEIERTLVLQPPPIPRYTPNLLTIVIRGRVCQRRRRGIDTMFLDSVEKGRVFLFPCIAVRQQTRSANVSLRRFMPSFSIPPLFFFGKVHSCESKVSNIP